MFDLSLNNTFDLTMAEKTREMTMIPKLLGRHTRTRTLFEWSNCKSLENEESEEINSDNLDQYRLLRYKKVLNYKYPRHDGKTSLILTTTGMQTLSTIWFRASRFKSR